MCLNILREDWKPVLNLNAVIVGLQVSHAGAQRRQTDNTLMMLVSFPRAERFGSVEQGGCPGSPTKP